MEPPEIPKHEEALEQSSLDVSKEIAGTRQTYKQIHKLGHMSFQNSITDVLVAIADYAEHEAANDSIRRTEMNTAEVLKDWDKNNFLFDPNDPTYALIVQAYKDVGEDARKKRALDTLFQMYVIAKSNDSYSDLDISLHIERIVAQPSEPFLKIVPDIE